MGFSLLFLTLTKVVILQPAPSRPFTAMMYNSLGGLNSLVNQVTSCLFSFVVEFANWFTFEASLKLALMC